MYKLNNPAAATMPYEYVLYTVTTIYDRSGCPTSCKLNAHTTTVNPLCIPDDYTEQIGKGRTRKTSHFFTVRDALDSMELSTNASVLGQRHFLSEEQALDAGDARNEQYSNVS